MADAGDIWYRAISHMGNNIASSIGEYRKRRERHEMVTGELDLLRNTMVDGKPVLDQKTFERLSAYRDTHKAYGDGALAAQLKMLEGLAVTGAKANFASNLRTRDAILRERLGERRDRYRASLRPNTAQKKDVEFADVFTNPIKEELGTADANMKPESFKGTEEKEANAARVIDRHGNVRVMPLEVYRRGKQTASTAEAQPVGTPSEKAQNIKRSYREGKITREAAIKALKDLGEGYN